MAISLHLRKFKHCLYDKRDDFNFSVISYPFLSGNIPKVPSYGVYSSQLLRLCHICSEYNQFKCEVIKLNKKLINQGFQLLSLKHKFELFSKKYMHVWGKYGADLLCDDILNTLFRLLSPILVSGLVTVICYSLNCIFIYFRCKHFVMVNWQTTKVVQRPLHANVVLLISSNI